MNVFRFSNETQVVYSSDVIVLQCQIIFRVVASIDKHQLVLVELDFHWFARIQDCDSATAVIDQKIFEVVQNALHDWHVDLFAIEIGMLTVGLVVTRFKNDVNGFAERIK